MRPSPLRAALLGAALALPAAVAPAASAQAPEPVDTAAVRILRAEGMGARSQVMETLWWITEANGPRLTGSAGLDRAVAWATRHLREQGLANVHTENWGPFGRGWTLNRFSVNATSANGAANFPVIAVPRAWSPSVRGTGEVVILSASTPEELAAYRGRLRGKVVFVDDAREVSEPFAPLARRHNTESLLALANYAADTAPAAPGQGGNAAFMGRFRIAQARMQMLAEEQPLVIVDRGSKGDYGTVFSGGASVPVPEGVSAAERPTAWMPRGQRVIPQMTLAVEHYNRIHRMVSRGMPVSLALDMDATYDEADPMEQNALAEIAGTDKADELVMLGAHFDSWHAGTGVTDNGAGSAVMMEAMCLLQETFRQRGTQPRRTIRLGLWTGEEQGLYGSRAYVAQHFGTRGADGGFAPTAGNGKVSAYFNMDNGTGMVRGVYSQGNEGVGPIFRAWLRPFHDLGAATVTMQNTGGTDHLAFDAVGIPGFQFIQEELAYSSRTHHSNMDVYDHAVAADLQQSATVIAAFAYHAAMREAPLPRKTR